MIAQKRNHCSFIFCSLCSLLQHECAMIAQKRNHSHTKEKSFLLPAAMHDTVTLPGWEMIAQKRNHSLFIFFVLFIHFSFSLFTFTTGVRNDCTKEKSFPHKEKSFLPIAATHGTVTAWMGNDCTKEKSFFVYFFVLFVHFSFSLFTFTM